MAEKLIIRDEPKGTAIEHENWRRINRRFDDIENTVSALTDSISNTTGGNIVYPFTSASAIVSGKVVYKTSSGSVNYATNATVAQANFLVGLSTNTVASGGICDVMLFGEYENTSWSWDVTKVIYLGTSGNMTQTAPTGGYIVKVATPISPTKVIFEIGIHILL
jgi:hypothetical protein